MFDKPEDVALARKRLGLTQKEFAIATGVSQSFIAKLEAGQLDPSFSHMKKIEQSIMTLQKKKTKVATDVMQKKVIIIHSSTTVAEAVTILKKHGFSQIPVEEHGIIGIITESLLLGVTGETKVSEIMAEAPPTIAKNTPVEAIVGLLKYVPAVLVGERGKIIGIITKTDVL